MKNPYEKKLVAKCNVCGQVVLVDEFGYGDCENCGWQQCEHDEEYEKKYKTCYPNLVPLSKAREQYKKGQPFRASLEDFMNGLYFYSEMRFEYKGLPYAVFLNKDGIEFSIDSEHDFLQHYKTREEFVEKAHIGEKLIKDIWYEIENPDFM